ncbi:MAG: LysR family transcriptional regulator [Emcibacter sp.]|nr:LysR family transcriptional regulator [Emcibacter sp.]
MPDITLNSLKSLVIFKTLYEDGTATKTAKTLGITQSGVSRSLGLLEDNIGISLFIREKNRLIPTPQAEELHKEILRLMFNLDEIKHSILALKEFGASRVRIATIPGIAYGYVPKIIAKILAINSKMNIYFDIMATNDVVRSVESGLFDVGFVTLPISSEQIQIDTIIKTEAICILPKKHPLTHNKIIDIKDLTDQHIIIPNQPNIAADQLLQLIADNNIKISGKTESNIASICSLVGNNVGLSVINSITAEDLYHKNMVTRPFTPTIHYSFGLIYRKNWRGNKLIQAIRENLSSTNNF